MVEAVVESLEIKRQVLRETSDHAPHAVLATNPSSLRLEDLAVQLGLIWHPLPPRTGRAVVFVFAADHGIAVEGVSLYPASVTRAMVATYLAGRAAVNALANFF